MIWKLEWLKLRRSHRPWLAVAATLLFLGLMLIGFYTYAVNESGGDAEFRYTFENRSYFNGLTFALYAFYFGFTLILPIFAVTEGGVQLAGETSSGTLLLLLTRPITRSRLFFVKAAVALGMSCILVVFLWLSSLGLGLIFIGWGDLDLYPGVLQMSESHQHFSQGQALLRFLSIVPASALAMCVPVCLSLMFSSFMRNPVNAIGISISIYLVLYVISEIHFFAELRPFLFTAYMGYWRELFQENIEWRLFFQDAAKLGGYALLFLGAAHFRFRTREET